MQSKPFLAAIAAAALLAPAAHARHAPDDLPPAVRAAPVAVTPASGFHWGDASIGAGVALGAVGGTAVLVTGRNRRLAGA